MLFEKPKIAMFKKQLFVKVDFFYKKLTFKKFFLLKV